MSPMCMHMCMCVYIYKAAAAANMISAYQFIILKLLLKLVKLLGYFLVCVCVCIGVCLCVQGRNSNSVWCALPAAEGKAPGPPSKVCASETDRTYVVLSWVPPVYHSKAPMWYYIEKVSFSSLPDVNPAEWSQTLFLQFTFLPLSPLIH